MRRLTAIVLNVNPAVFQLCLGVPVLLACLLLPRHGGAVLLVPLFTASTGAIDRGHIAVLRAGWLRGSVLVQIDGDVPVIGFLRHGVLPLGAPGWFCNPATVSARQLEKATLR